MTKKTSWAKKQIALLQLDAQETMLNRSILQVELNLRPHSNRETWVLRDELRRELSLLDAVRTDIKELPCRRRMPWSRLVVKIYTWATRERFDF